MSFLLPQNTKAGFPFEYLEEDKQPSSKFIPNVFERDFQKMRTHFFIIFSILLYRTYMWVESGEVTGFCVKIGDERLHGAGADSSSSSSRRNGYRCI